MEVIFTIDPFLLLELCANTLKDDGLARIIGGLVLEI